MANFSLRSCPPALFASWCNGSTRDSGSLCLGSSPSEAASLFDVDLRRGRAFFAKEILKHRRAITLEHAARYFRMVIEGVVLEQIHYRSARAGANIGAAENHTAYAG